MYNKYKNFVDNIIDNSEDFMIINKEEEVYLLFDRFVLGLSEKAMPWLFKVFLEQYSILKNDNFTLDIRSKYTDLTLRLLNENGHIFVNKDGLYAILIELEKVNQVKYNEKEKLFSLV